MVDDNSARRLRTGISLWLDRPVDEIAEVAAAAETAGIDDIWVADHYFLRDAYVALAAIAKRTKTARLGTAVAAAQLRHPTLIASSAATVDELSGGRAVIGVGPGGHEFAAELGMRPRSPLRLVREAVTIIRGLLAGQVEVEGQYYSADRASLTWPARTIPIYLSARGPKMTELAGEIADGVIVHGVGREYLEYVAAQAAHGAERSGRNADTFEIALVVDVEVDDDTTAAIDRVRRRLKVTAGGSWADSLIPVYGLDPDDVARLKAAVSAGDPGAPDLVTDEMVHAFAVAGPAAEVASRLRTINGHGVDRVILKLGEGDTRSTMEQINRVEPVLAEVSE